MENVNIKGIEQGRAKYAYDCAILGKEIQSKKKMIVFNNKYFEDKNYKSYVKKVPTLIKTNGLGAAFAFIKSKEKKEKKENNQVILPGDERNPKNAYDLIYIQTSNWFAENRNYLLPNYTKDKDFINEIIQLNSSEYRAVTNEVFALFNWLRRFAEGLIEGEEDN